MRLTFQVSVEIDPVYLNIRSNQAARDDTVMAWKPPCSYVGQIVRAKQDESENALADALMHKDGIVAGSVTVIRQEK